MAWGSRTRKILLLGALGVFSLGHCSGEYSKAAELSGYDPTPFSHADIRAYDDRIVHLERKVEDLQNKHLDGLVVLDSHEDDEGVVSLKVRDSQGRVYCLSRNLPNPLSLLSDGSE